ncbi:hypothetical protein BJ138DRAFT_1002110 [Hygrophoropsis aurantiaca]|uniref:Uncharacterized protein n=1 Tax=Hygrophoropsis aurantiaca TaxID=72124 RepID=A0ACB8AKL4_9AGAM|nr:hypothetical protein BJ138DRAFT_1002110 [Hygrophoropsis aurantiaca]
MGPSQYVGHLQHSCKDQIKIYSVFTPSDDSEPASQHKGDVDGPIASSLLEASNKARRNPVNEWSCALTDKRLSTQKDPARARKDFYIGQKDIYANTSAGRRFGVSAV